MLTRRCLLELAGHRGHVAYANRVELSAGHATAARVLARAAGEGPRGRIVRFRQRLGER
jgi:hypothetical protein